MISNPPARRLRGSIMPVVAIPPGVAFPMPASKTPWSRRGGRKGAAIVEMAFLLPVFATLVFAMLEATRMCMVAHLLTNAAREGCRVAVSNGKKWTDVTARVTATLQVSHLDSVVTITPTSSAVENTRLGDPISVTLSVPFSQVSWLSSPFFYRSTTISATAWMSSERP